MSHQNKCLIRTKSEFSSLLFNIHFVLTLILLFIFIFAFRLRFELDILNICSKETVPELEKRPKITDIIRMMEIVISRSSTERQEFWLCPTPFIPRMSITCLYNSERQENPNCNRMDRINVAQNFVSNKCRKWVSEDVLNWMCIFRGDAYCVTVFMVLFVNPVKLRSMQGWMTQVKE